MIISKDKLYSLVGQINEITNTFHSIHEYRGRYKLYIRNNNQTKDITSFMSPKHLFSWMTAYLKGLREGKMLMLDTFTKDILNPLKDE